MSTNIQMEQLTFAGGLRALADLADKAPAVFEHEDLLVALYCETTKEMRDKARALGGRWDKNSNDMFFELSRNLGPIEVRLYAYRSTVCERVVVGTEMVDVKETVVTGQVEREIVKWECPKSVWADGDDS